MGAVRTRESLSCQLETANKSVTVDSRYRELDTVALRVSVSQSGIAHAATGRKLLELSLSFEFRHARRRTGWLSVFARAGRLKSAANEAFRSDSARACCSQLSFDA